jgi:urease accessory protein
MTTITEPSSITSPAGHGSAGLLSESPISLLHLMRLTSPLLPIGAFAYSQGLEQAIHLGWVRNAFTLEAWLRGLLRAPLVYTDLAILRRAHRAWKAADVAAARLLAQTLLALRESSELRQEELHLGSGLLRLLRQQEVPGAEALTGDHERSYVVSFALAAVHFGVSEAATLHGYCFAWLENQVSAALRCMSFGQSEAQAVLGQLLEHVPDAVAHSARIADDELGFASVGLALASADHETLYSRLFRS